MKRVILTMWLMILMGCSGTTEVSFGCENGPVETSGPRIGQCKYQECSRCEEQDCDTICQSGFSAYTCEPGEVSPTLQCYFLNETAICCFDSNY